MKNYLKYGGMTFTIVVLCLCSCTGNKGVMTPTSSGYPYELIVVVEPGVWNRPAGRTLYEALISDIAGLPQSEPAFKVMYTAPNDYTSILKLVRNIIIVDIQPDKYTQAKFTQAKDVYATPQIIVNIQAPNEEEFQKFVEENKEGLITFFTHAEMNRQIMILEKKHNDFISQKVKEMFDCEIWLPGELNSSKTDENFFWASTNKATADQNFLIYAYPYRDRNTFTKEYFVHVRDSVMKINMPGAPKNSYMITDSAMTVVKPLNWHGNYVFEARGLWRMKGDFMGGPFVSHSRVDTKNNRIITAEVFIYSPDKSKGNLLRRTEASLYTLKLPEERNKEEQESNTIPGK
ncbi:hypothetical protein EZS27_009882 [termite gut metagenome]|jgi:hypothetical protein|uniref:DUF4837 domain-containing protein n=1 Tax=termite gut metagenome TaxID=433724 RepID=A0A5J4SA79_9ZZZZ